MRVRVDAPCKRPEETDLRKSGGKSVGTKAGLCAYNIRKRLFELLSGIRLQDFESFE
jgi:hypothetical protein